MKKYDLGYVGGRSMQSHENGERDKKEKWSEMKGERDLEREKEGKKKKGGKMEK